LKFQNYHYLRPQKAPKQATKVFVRNVKTKMAGDYQSHTVNNARSRSEIEENVLDPGRIHGATAGRKESSDFLPKKPGL
jgi:hypothetical protein